MSSSWWNAVMNINIFSLECDVWLVSLMSRQVEALFSICSPLDYEVNKDPGGKRRDKHGLYNSMACIMYWCSEFNSVAGLSK